ncbi:hypothetical protein AAFF_G00330470 [Aldrovandia affinis]|uniref:Uncharacterized protein n=1 Tax=Aldrovandia affinis TaxID=143900 RepID=A0AAD7SP14_9TELE|nr:hypothetical protein AAFF_G00330470 [Aldrovandia affinis]
MAQSHYHRPGQAPVALRRQRPHSEDMPVSAGAVSHVELAGPFVFVRGAEDGVKVQVRPAGGIERTCSPQHLPHCSANRQREAQR